MGRTAQRSPDRQFQRGQGRRVPLSAGGVVGRGLRVLRPDVPADRRTDQGQRADPPRVGEREVQRRLPAHAQSDQRGAIQAEVVKDGSQVLDIVEGLVRQAGTPQTAGVVTDDVVIADQLRNNRVPQAGIHARAVQQDDRAAGAAAFGPQPTAARGGNVDFGCVKGVGLSVCELMT